MDGSTESCRGNPFLSTRFQHVGVTLYRDMSSGACLSTVQPCKRDFNFAFFESAGMRYLDGYVTLHHTLLTIPWFAQEKINPNKSAKLALSTCLTAHSCGPCVDSILSLCVPGSRASRTLPTHEIPWPSESFITIGVG